MNECDFFANSFSKNNVNHLLLYMARKLINYAKKRLLTLFRLDLFWVPEPGEDTLSYNNETWKLYRTSKTVTFKVRRMRR